MKKLLAARWRSRGPCTCATLPVGKLRAGFVPRRSLARSLLAPGQSSSSGLPVPGLTRLPSRVCQPETQPGPQSGSMYAHVHPGEGGTRGARLRLTSYEPLALSAGRGLVGGPFSVGLELPLCLSPAPSSGFLPLAYVPSSCMYTCPPASHASRVLCTLERHGTVQSGAE